MTPEQALQELKEINQLTDGDCETHHMDADAILLDLLTSLGYHEIVDAYCDISKWYA